MSYYKKITFFENNKRLQKLSDFRQAVVEYFNNCRRDHYTRGMTENSAAQNARVNINRNINEISAIVHYSGLHTIITVTPPPLLGGYIQRIDLIQNIFLLHEHSVNPQQLIDLLERSFGIYFNNQIPARIRTFNPFFWLDRLFSFIAAIPFYFWGKLGFNAKRAEQSQLGKLIKGFGYLLTLFVSILTALNLLGILDDVKKIVVNQGKHSINLNKSDRIDTISIREYNLKTGIEDGPLVEKYEIKKLPDGIILKCGFYFSYYKSGKINSKLYYRANLRNGTAIYYNEYGNIMKKGFYKNDKKDSTWIQYYDNGSIKERSNYSHGKVNGKVKTWYPNGQMSFYGIYSNDTLDTLYMWHENGKESRKSIYINTMEEETCWNDKGVIIHCEDILSKPLKEQ